MTPPDIEFLRNSTSKRQPAEPHDNGLSLVLSLAYFPKERTERIISMYKNKGATYVGNSLVCLCEKIVSVLFEQGAAKKNIFRCAKSNSVDKFRSLRRATRALPTTRDLFEKRSIKNFYELGRLKLLLILLDENFECLDCRSDGSVGVVLFGSLVLAIHAQVSSFLIPNH